MSLTKTLYCEDCGSNKAITCQGDIILCARHNTLRFGRDSTLALVKAMSQESAIVNPNPVIVKTLPVINNEVSLKLQTILQDVDSDKKKVSNSDLKKDLSVIIKSLSYLGWDL